MNFIKEFTHEDATLVFTKSDLEKLLLEFDAWLAIDLPKEQWLKGLPSKRGLIEEGVDRFRFKADMLRELPVSHLLFLLQVVMGK